MEIKSLLTLIHEHRYPSITGRLECVVSLDKLFIHYLVRLDSPNINLNNYKMIYLFINGAKIRLRYLVHIEMSVIKLLNVADLDDLKLYKKLSISKWPCTLKMERK